MELCICAILWGGLVEEFKLLNDVSGILFAIERNSPQPRRPSFKFSHPVGDCGIWHNNKNRKSIPFFGYIPQECSYLNCFALESNLVLAKFCKKSRYANQTHVIRKDTMLVIPPVITQPIEAINLSSQLKNILLYALRTYLERQEFKIWSRTELQL